MIHLPIHKPFEISLPNVYRYMDEEFIDLFFEKGCLRISSLKRFSEYPDEIRGDIAEGGGMVTSVFENNLTHIVSKKVGFNAYILCGSTVESDSIKKIFATNSCFRIVQPLEFAIAASNSILGFIGSSQGFCNYREERILRKSVRGHPNPTEIPMLNNDNIDLMFLKKRKYQNQCEYRFTWHINTQFYPMSEYIDIECKEAIQFCEKVGII